jgi:peptidoglycan/xylan/chitin deacetylase (PgdA/CDA1 family)
LLYHNLLTEPANEIPVAGNQITISTFRDQMHRLRDRLLHPKEVHDELMRGRMPRGVMITFDDGAAGIVEAGKILADFGVAGVAFVCPGAVRDGLWFYQLADALARAVKPRLHWRGSDLPLTSPADRCVAYKSIFDDLFDLPNRERNEALDKVIKMCQPLPGESSLALSVLDRNGLERAAETGGVIFGNHSWSHPNIEKLPTDELMHEVRAAQDWIETSGLPFLPWFAYPCGKYDERARKLVGQVCAVTFGARAREVSPKVIPRTGIYPPDSNGLRFALKTTWEGRVRGCLSLGGRLF